MPAKPLQGFSVAAPGFKGLNTQDSSVTLDSGFALEANNCVIDKGGRLASRKGWKPINAVSASLPAGQWVETLFEFIKPNGEVELISAGNKKIFKGSNSLTDITPGSYTVLDNNWTCCDLNDEMWLFQYGQTPLVYRESSGTYSLIPVTQSPRYRIPDTLFEYPKADIVISAVGRLWMANAPTDTQTVWFSDLLDGANIATGTSGRIDVNKIWPNSTDTITGLAVHNNFLIIFGQFDTLVYENADDPANLVLRDTLSGVGCVSHRSIQYTGSDVVWLSQSGLRSFNRTIQEKSLPLTDLTRNVRDDFISMFSTERRELIRSVYYEREGFYLITARNANTTWYVDTRMMLPDGAARIMKWTSFAPHAYAVTRLGQLFMGFERYIGTYRDYQDNTSSYTMTYKSNWVDLGAPLNTKILKRIAATLIGGSAQNITFNWAFDYQLTSNTQSKAFPTLSSSQYNIDEYNIAEWGAGFKIDTLKIPATGSGQVIQAGLETTVNNTAVSLQKFSIYVKEGRLL